MKNKRYMPLVDKLFWIISVPAALLALFPVVISAANAQAMLFWTVPVALFIFYFLISPLFGYVELRESSVFIKYGFFLKKEIPYNKIRGVEKGRKYYSESMMSLKNSLEHVNIKYNSFDITTVSVIGNNDLADELMKRRNVK